MTSITSLNHLTAVTLVALFGATPAAAKFDLYSFVGGKHGSRPNGVIADATGALYGDGTLGGGCNIGQGCGVIYKLTPPAAGKHAWKQSVLFTFGNSNGADPEATLLLGPHGELYGTTIGGAGGNCVDGCGNVFEVIPPAAGKTKWTQTQLHVFNAGSDGWEPDSGLIADANGALYGTTPLGGSSGCDGSGCGVVYRLTPPPAGQTAWTYTILYVFTDGADGAGPSGALLFDANGNLYGTASGGGNGTGSGTVFELSPPGGGGTPWAETTLYSFSGTDGSEPVAAVIADAGGALYGTTEEGGSGTHGVVFKLTPPTRAGHPWTEAVLVNFSGANGWDPQGGLVMDASGNLYGTTAVGGAGCSLNSVGCGTVFKLSKPAHPKGAWKQKILHSFNGATGYNPIASMVFGAGGLLYGTSGLGGTDDLGTVFSLKP
jgi:uncharacterized repeat protein (TIGR03803 family)